MGADSEGFPRYIFNLRVERESESMLEGFEQYQPYHQHHIQAFLSQPKVSIMAFFVYVCNNSSLMQKTLAMPELTSIQ